MGCASVKDCLVDSKFRDEHTDLLRRLQRHSFDYFINETNSDNGLVLDKTSGDWPASIAAMGMALTAYTVGVARHFIAREEGAVRTLTTLRFLAKSDQSGAADSSGFKGFYFHFLDMKTGRRAWNCELSSIDTALLMAGVLTGAEFFDGPSDDETEIRELAKTLYERVDWQWMLDGEQTICHGWTPEKGFLKYHWQGYDEALILYLLALGSPTHPIPPACYAEWCKTYEWITVYGTELLYAGPLFIHQMSHVWCDFRGIRDEFMRGKGIDYFENSRRVTLIQQQYAIANPNGFAQYGELVWGVTASDGPGLGRKVRKGVKRKFFDYVARGAPYGPDDGTIAPWAVAASLPFAPEIVVPTLANFSAMHVKVPNPYGFKASFNPTAAKRADDRIGWVSPYHFGINEGPTVLMIENYRSELIWSLMQRCAPLKAGLVAAGFTGGWLDA